MNKENNVLSIFSERLKSLLNERDLKLKNFSAEIGIPDSTISDWLLKKSHPSIENIPKIAKYFKVSTDYLLGLVDFES